MNVMLMNVNTVHEAQVTVRVYTAHATTYMAPTTAHVTQVTKVNAARSTMTIASPTSARMAENVGMALEDFRVSVKVVLQDRHVTMTLMNVRQIHVKMEPSVMSM